MQMVIGHGTFLNALPRQRGNHSAKLNQAQEACARRSGRTHRTMWSHQAGRLPSVLHNKRTLPYEGCLFNPIHITRSNNRVAGRRPRPPESVGGQVLPSVLRRIDPRGYLRLMRLMLSRQSVRSTVNRFPSCRQGIISSTEFRTRKRFRSLEKTCIHIVLLNITYAGRRFDVCD